MNILTYFDKQFIDGLAFCQEAYHFFETIRGEQDGISKIRLRETDREKKLLEEILPICTYIQSIYRPGRYISVCWHYGNQNFDAEIKQTGWLVEEGFFRAHHYLEVTCVMHPNEYLGRERINTIGYTFGVKGLRRLKTREIESEVTVHDGQDFVEEFAELLINRIKDKASKFYPANTILIVHCTLNNLYTPDDWEYLKRITKQANIHHAFTEIYIFETVSYYSFKLYPHS